MVQRIIHYTVSRLIAAIKAVEGRTGSLAASEMRDAWFEAHGTPSADAATKLATSICKLETYVEVLPKFLKFTGEDEFRCFFCVFFFLEGMSAQQCGKRFFPYVS